LVWQVHTFGSHARVAEFKLNPASQDSHLLAFGPSHTD